MIDKEGSPIKGCTKCSNYAFILELQGQFLMLINLVPDTNFSFLDESDLTKFVQFVDEGGSFFLKSWFQAGQYSNQEISVGIVSHGVIPSHVKLFGLQYPIIFLDCQEGFEFLNEVREQKPYVELVLNV